MQNGLQAFIPLYWVAMLMQTPEQGSLMVTVIACASVVGAFSGGRLADRFGFRRTVRVALAPVFILIFLTLVTKSVWVATALVALSVVMSSITQSPMVVLGQKYLPNRLGLASGVTFGLAISMGGICSPLLGTIGDKFGLTVALYVVSGVALVAFLGTMFLKEPAVLAKKSDAAEQ